VSSAVLYLAIVALWAVVLVPMWLRRDAGPVRQGFSWLSHRRSASQETAGEPYGPEPYLVDDDSADDAMDEVGGDEIPDDEIPDEPDLLPRRRNSRAAVIARRRRRTSGLVLSLLISAAVTIAGLTPWWVVLPPVGLLAAHVCLLRVAVGIDTMRRAAALARAETRAKARDEARAAARAARQAEAAAHAEIIDLMERNRAREVFDQYADEGQRAVGD
jgi:hypothetical protein